MTLAPRSSYPVLMMNTSSLAKDQSTLFTAVNILKELYKNKFKDLIRIQD